MESSIRTIPSLSISTSTGNTVPLAVPRTLPPNNPLLSSSFALCKDRSNSNHSSQYGFAITTNYNPSHSHKLNCTCSCNKKKKKCQIHHGTHFNEFYGKREEEEDEENETIYIHEHKKKLLKKSSHYHRFTIEKNVNANANESINYQANITKINSSSNSNSSDYGNAHFHHRTTNNNFNTQRPTTANTSTTTTKAGKSTMTSYMSSNYKLEELQDKLRILENENDYLRRIAYENNLLQSLSSTIESALPKGGKPSPSSPSKTQIPIVGTVTTASKHYFDILHQEQQQIKQREHKDCNQNPIAAKPLPTNLPFYSINSNSSFNFNSISSLYENEITKKRKKDNFIIEMLLPNQSGEQPDIHPKEYSREEQEQQPEQNYRNHLTSPKTNSHQIFFPPGRNDSTMKFEDEILLHLRHSHIIKAMIECIGTKNLTYENYNNIWDHHCVIQYGTIEEEIHGIYNLQYIHYEILNCFENISIECKSSYEKYHDPIICDFILHGKIKSDHVKPRLISFLMSGDLFNKKKKNLDEETHFTETNENARHENQRKINDENETMENKYAHTTKCAEKEIELRIRTVVIFHKENNKILFQFFHWDHYDLLNQIRF